MSSVGVQHISQLLLSSQSGPQSAEVKPTKFPFGGSVTTSTYCRHQRQMHGNLHETSGQHRIDFGHDGLVPRSRSDFPP